VQVALNGGALVTGGVVWKMYFENLRATVTSKDAALGAANERLEFWRDKANDLEKRTPEAVERVLAERIKLREEEIGRLAEDKEHGSQELASAKEEVAVMRRALEQTEGFRAMLAMEEPDPDDPEYQKYLEYLESNGLTEAEDDAVVKIEVAHLGNVGVDSGQLLITDPCYVDSEWEYVPLDSDRDYRDTKTGETVKWREEFLFDYDKPIEPYGESPRQLIQSGRLVQQPEPPAETQSYSYNGACRATLGKGYGELAYKKGHPGAGVAFSTAWGDGVYPVYGEMHDGHIVRVYVNTG
jgi:hypothetical protein